MHIAEDLTELKDRTPLLILSRLFPMADARIKATKWKETSGL